MDNILETLEIEGFDYAFTSYSAFGEIKDEQFHKLRKEFLAAREALKSYIEEQTSQKIET